MNPGTRPLFVYGTLRDPEMLAAVIGRKVPASQRLGARAPGYRAAFLAGRSYPALVPGRGRARGFVLLGLSGEEMDRLDRFEGEEYRRAEIEVVVADGVIAAEAYFAVAPIEGEARTWSLAGWRRTHKRAELAAVAITNPSAVEPGGPSRR